MISISPHYLFSRTGLSHTGSRFVAAACIFLSATFCASTFAAPSAGSATSLAADAEELINQSGHNRQLLIDARQKIAEALRQNPASMNALVQQGRIQLIVGQDMAAESSFLAAVKAEPEAAKPYILLGHLYTKTGRLPDAKIALTRADAIGSNDPWLHLNWSDYYEAMRDNKQQLEHALQALNVKPLSPRMQGVAFEQLERYYTHTNADRAKADEYYRKLIELNPKEPFYRGNYARDVMIYFSDFEAGQRMAEEALALSDYPHARQTLSLAHYALWSQAAASGKDQATVDRLFSVATTYDPGAKMLPECAMAFPRLQPLLWALKRKGLYGDTVRC